ncbi:MAG TPA: ABC transporter substrate-binding protein [Opitutus sp.]|nr:ABC transporter substrate-binding protein [Opitutus sp.]
MAALLRRLSLGLLLIAGASALLLFSDLGSRKNAMKARAAAASPATSDRASTAAPAVPARTMRVAILQHASQMVLDQGRAGVMEGLADRGWAPGRNLDIKLYNAEGDMPVAQAIAKEMANGGYDLLLTISTPSLQAVANANRVTKVPHVFGLVTDPYGAGVGISRDNHLDHPAWLAGYGTMQPVAQAFKTARAMNPALATVGVVWNAAESNSEAQVKLARKVCADLGITLLESTVDNSAGVAEAANALVARGVDTIWMGGDVTVMNAVDAVIAAAKKGGIPTFTVIPPNAKRGALFDLGADYGAVGRLEGQLAGEILSGRSPASVAVDNIMPELLAVNQQALAGLRGTWTIPADLLARAQLVIDAEGVVHEKAAAAPTAPPMPSPSAAPRAVAGRTYRIAFAYFAPDASLDSCQRGLLDGMKELGYVEGQNLVVERSHAQGEMMNISQMIQNLDHTDADVLVPFSTPVLQGALAMAKLKPIVFTYITDPIAAGAGTTLEDHRPNVTGVGSLPPIEDTIKIIRRALPQVKTIGTIYNSGEANSRKILSLLRESVQRHDLQLVELTAANSNEVVQDAQALVTRHVDAIYVPGDNTAYLAFDGIIKVADSAGIPVINDDPDYFDRGPLLTCGPGFYYSGKAAAPLLARVLSGEDPAKIPMQNVSVNVTKFSRAVAAKLGLQVPDDLIREIESPAAAAMPAAPAPVAKNPNPSGRKWKIAVVSYSETPPAEETLAGMNEAWQHSALVAGRDYEIKLRSAQGDMSALGGLFDAAVTDGADIIVPLSTPATQTAVQRIKDRPIVFSLVANPMAAGAGKSYTDHRPNVTGIAVMAPFEEALDLVQKYFPAYKRLGTLYCPAEANSVDLQHSLEAACQRRGLVLESVAANTASEFPDAALALVSRRIDAILQISDNLSSASFTALTRAARQAQKPLISLNSTTIPLGAAVSFGRDYYNAGEATTALLERVIAGEDPAKIPFTLPPKVLRNASPENAAAVGMTLPPALLREFEAGKKSAPAAGKTAPAPTATAPARPSGKKKIALVLYNETPPAEETLAGMADAWKRSAFVEGRDYEIKLRSAQGDMGLLSGIFDAVLTDGADVVVTLSTPTLQMAVKKVTDRPIVFTLVTNPMAAGAGKSYTDHLANVTGIAVLAPMNEALDMIQRHFPQYRRLGTLYCPAEANAVYLKEALEQACAARGFVLETVAANTSADLSDAALALVSRPIDAVLQIPDALSSAGFSAIARAARQHQTPLLALNSTVVPLGAAVALGRDFHNSGEATVAVIERILRGEKPAGIPIELPPKVVYSASPANAAAVGMTLPPALLAEAIIIK